MAKVPAWAEQFKANLLGSIQIMIDEANEKLKKDLQTEFQKANDFMNESIDEVNRKSDILDKKVNGQGFQIIALQRQQKLLAERIEYLECRSMRENLVFSGIPEDENETTDTIRRSLYEIINKDLKIADEDILIINCHRLKKKRNQTTRDIIARFANFHVKQKVIHNAKLLKGRQPPLFINEQYPENVEKRRNLLRPIMKLAKQNKMKANLARDKLIINDRPYTVETMGTVPLDTKSLAHKMTEEYIFFNGRLSPYSNFYRCKFVVQNTQYTSVEQYYQHAKALHAEDEETATEILMCDDPGKIKHLGDSISVDTSWTYVMMDHMEKALRAKFEQNIDLQQDLLRANGRKLVEANAYDRYWGIGKGIRDPDLDDETKWAGENQLGTLLNAITADYAVK